MVYNDSMIESLTINLRSSNCLCGDRIEKEHIVVGVDNGTEDMNQAQIYIQCKSCSTKFSVPLVGISVSLNYPAEYTDISVN